MIVRENDLEKSKMIIQLNTMEIKKEILNIIQVKDLDIVELANACSLSLDAFQRYMNDNSDDVSFYLRLLELVQDWEV